MYFPVGGSFIGNFDTGAFESETTTYADVVAVDLASDDPHPRARGRVQLARPYPTDARIQAYSLFLDAQADKFLFFDLDTGSPANPRPWEHPQRLYLATLNGPTLDLGRYSGFGREHDVWGALSPDGKHAVVSSDFTLANRSTYCAGAAIDLINTETGQIDHIHPTEPADGPQSFTISRAWWGADSTLYANYQQWPCQPDSIQQPPPPPPSVWTYRNGRWDKLDTDGPAIYALKLPGDRTAVVVPSPNQKSYDVPRGSLSILNPDGTRTHLTDGVTAISPLTPSNAP